MCGPGLIVPLIFPQTATESARARRGAAPSVVLESGTN